MIYYVDDLYPRDDPRDGARLVRFSHLQLSHYLDQRNGTGSGKIALRSTSPDAAFINPDGLDYIRKRRVNTAVVDGSTPSGFSEAVVGGFFLEADEHLALDRTTKRLLTLNGAGALSYLDREQMWSHTYETWGKDPSEGGQPDTWNLFAQSTIFAGGDFLGAILWRVVHEGLGFRGAPGYAATPLFDDDKTESAIPFVVLTFDGFTDTDGNPWTIPSGEFRAQVGESLLSVTKRLMEAGLYVELDPDTFELRAWELANHGRDRTGVAWGANVIRFVPSPDEDTDTGNILNDLKRSQVAKIRRTQMLAGGQNVYGTAVEAGAVPWHGFYPADVADVDALDAIADRQLDARNDAGDMVQVRIKVGNDAANGYYLPGEHILVDDRVTLHTGTGEWDWDEAAYPVAAWSVTTRRAGAPDVFVHLGSMYSTTTDRQFQVGGSGPSRLLLCDPATDCTALTSHQLIAGTATNGNVESGATNWSGGAVTVVMFHGGTQGYGTTGAAILDASFDFGAQTFVKGTRYIVDGWMRASAVDHDTTIITFGDAGGDEESTTYVGGLGTDPADLWEENAIGADGELWHRFRVCWIPSADRTNVRVRVQVAMFASADIAVDDIVLYTTSNNPLAGTGARAARCDHGHEASAITFRPTVNLTATDVQAAIEEAAQAPGASHSNLVDRDADEAHAQYLTRRGGGGHVIAYLPSAGTTPELDVAVASVFDLTLTADATPTIVGWDAGVERVITIRLRGEFAFDLSAIVDEWLIGDAPAPASDGFAYHEFQLATDDGGATVRGYNVGSLAGNSATSLLTVDAGTITYDEAGDDVVIEVAAMWGYDADGPYFNGAGVTTGEEALLAVDPSTGEFAVVPYNP